MGSASSTNSHRGQRDSWRHYIAAGRLGTTDILKQTTMQQDNFSTENEDSDYSLYYCLVFQRVPAASVLDGSRTEWMWIRSTTWGRGEHWQLPVSTASWWSRNTNTEKNKPSLGSTNGKKKKKFCNCYDGSGNRIWHIHFKNSISKRCLVLFLMGLVSVYTPNHLNTAIT